jgi:hypothetical protein
MCEDGCAMRMDTLKNGRQSGRRCVSMVDESGQDQNVVMALTLIGEKVFFVLRTSTGS